MTLSKERLEHLANLETPIAFTKAEIQAMARELLERRERDKQEPVRYMNRFTGACFTLEQQPDAATDTAVYVPLHAEQPAPVLPEEMPHGMAGQIVSLLSHNIGDKFLAQKIWNACRAAMHKGGQP